ncbi:MAG: FecR family protein [Candidatus Korobacteraceae bacterium]
MAKRTEYALVMMTVVLLAAVSAQATSHVRIVRLSYESGNVRMDRGTGQGLERALLNSPIVEGSRIVTGNDGLAEVEFENNSVVRIGEATEVRFRQLLMNDAGYKVNEVELVNGTVYVDARSEKGDIYRVVAENQVFEVQRNSQARFQTSGNQVQVAVVNGSANFETTPQPVAIKKSFTLLVDSANPSGYLATKGVDKVPLDAWNNERAAYQNAYSYNNDPYGGKGLSSAGYQDLAYYGGFMTVPGYGLAWQPYGASSWTGWDPYMTGAWAYTPGFGYAWASAYPWGWMPYHYGSWAYQPVIGWFWYPGNSFNGGGVVTNWQATAPVVNAPAGYHAPVPPTSPTNGNRAAVLVGQIGRMPAYLPGGPVPPNFRSVIQDHSGLSGTTAPLSGSSGNSGGGSSVAARNARSANSRNVYSANRTGSSFASPRAGAYSGGHVFVVPQSSFAGWSSGGFGTAASPSVGRSSGTAVPASSGMGHASHAGAGGTPK